MGIRENRKSAILSTSKANFFLIVTFVCRHSNDLFLNFVKILKNKNARLKKRVVFIALQSTVYVGQVACLCTALEIQNRQLKYNNHETINLLIIDEV